MVEPPQGPERILMTTDTVGGVWEYSLELVRHLAVHGTEVVLASMGPLPTLQQRTAAALPNLLLEPGDYPLEWMPGSTAGVARAGDWLRRLERRYVPEILHLNGYAHAPLPWRAPCLVVAHSCVCSWWAAVRGGEPPAEWNAYRSMVGRALRAAGLVVAPTTALLRQLEALYGPIPHGRTIWNGRNLARYLPAAKEPFIFTAGRLWDEAKNVAALDGIAADLPWPVLVAGDWRHPQGGGHQPQKARCLGPLDVPEVAGLLGRAAIYALPARYEPFGLTVLEAALCGCALVLGDIPTLRELWDGAALFVPADDRAALREALQELIESPARRAELALAARRRSLVYGAARMAAAYLEAYGELLQPAALPSGLRLAGKTWLPAPPALNS